MIETRETDFTNRNKRDLLDKQDRETDVIETRETDVTNRNKRE